MPKITKAQHIDALLQTALAAISHVGLANYDHRERAARIAVLNAADKGKYFDPEKVEEELDKRQQAADEAKWAAEKRP
jgi:predicted transcriptional regulator